MSILTKALLVKLSISQFNPKRQDTKTTKEVLNAKQAKATAGVWVKNLIDPKTLDAIMSVAQASRQEHYKLSLPWRDEGWRILPTAMYQKYYDTLRTQRLKFQGQVTQFIEKYPEYIQEAQSVLNSMFNPNDYPSVSKVQSKFGFSVDFAPLPSGNDFRINLASDKLEAIQQNVDKQVAEATTQAMKDLWVRLADPVKKIVDKLSEPEAIFRDSLIGNLTEIIDLIPSLNVTDNQDLLKLTEECKKQLTTYNPEILRLNKDVRADTANKAQEILKRMEGYL